MADRHKKLLFSELREKVERLHGNCLNLPKWNSRYGEFRIELAKFPERRFVDVPSNRNLVSFALDGWEVREKVLRFAEWLEGEFASTKSRQKREFIIATARHFALEFPDLKYLITNFCMDEE